MKPQQRQFIVEVKSARRHSTIRPSSIWGDTDLKALAREAETEAPHLFEPADLPSEFCPVHGVEVCSNDGTRADDAHISDPVTVTEEVSGIQEASDSASILPSEEDCPTTTSPRVSKRQRRTRVRRAGGGTTIAATAVPSDDLAALEEENRRLKGLLAQNLQQENIKLRKMFERFGTD